MAEETRKDEKRIVGNGNSMLETLRIPVSELEISRINGIFYLIQGKILALSSLNHTWDPTAQLINEIPSHS